MSRPLLTRQEVAKRLSVSAAWFYRNRRGLEAKGFPPSLPGFAQGRWCPRAVELWIERNSGAPQAQEAAPIAETLEDRQEIGRAQHRTPVTNAPLECRPLLEQKKHAH